MISVSATSLQCPEQSYVFICNQGSQYVVGWTQQLKQTVTPGREGPRDICAACAATCRLAAASRGVYVDFCRDERGVLSLLQRAPDEIGKPGAAGGIRSSARRDEPTPGPIQPALRPQTSDTTG